MDNETIYEGVGEVDNIDLVNKSKKIAEDGGVDNSISQPKLSNQDRTGTVSNLKHYDWLDCIWV